MPAKVSDPLLGISNQELVGLLPSEVFQYGVEYGLVLQDILRKVVAKRYRVRAGNYHRIQNLLLSYGYGGTIMRSSELKWVEILVDGVAS